MHDQQTLSPRSGLAEAMTLEAARRPDRLDAGAIEYASWGVTPGTIEYDSWSDAFRPRRNEGRG